MGSREIVSLYDGFFSGGARILHTDVVVGLQERGRYKQSVVSINSEVHRENTPQRMEDDGSHKRLVRAGVGVASLGRRAFSSEVDYSPFTSLEQDQFSELTKGAGLIWTVKEQPLRLVNQMGHEFTTPTVVGLHRSDPEHQGLALDHLRLAIEMGRVVGCIATAEEARQAYAANGVPIEMIHLVRNAIDLERFKPSAEHRQKIRAEQNIPDDSPVVAFAARFDPMKDVPLFLKSAQHYLHNNQDAVVMLCGAGMTEDNPEVRMALENVFANKSSLAHRLRFLGIRSDMEAIYAAADIVSSTSLYGETYPLCLMEGLACGAVPVATEVGDSADIVGEGRGILTSRDPVDIAMAWQLAFDKRSKFLSAIEATKHRFSRKRMIDDYDAIIGQYV